MIGRVSVRGRVYGRPTICGEWQLNLGDGVRAAYHVVTRGSCWLHAPGLGTPRRLSLGDVVFFPRDTPHRLSSSDTLRPGDAAKVSPGSEESTQLLCGTYEGDDTELARLLCGVPDVVEIDAASGGEQMTHLVGLITTTAHAGGAGSSAVLDGLSDALLALVLRHCVLHGQIGGGALAALADPRLAEALSAMHANPGRAWTVDDLAKQAALSRSTFCERFMSTVGSAPLHYLTEIRMAEAEALLRSGQFSVALIAERVGYGTEAAFRRAFRRVTGRTPGEARAHRAWS